MKLSLNVLVAHQNDQMLDMLDSALTQSGCRISRICRSQDELIAAAISNSPDLIVTGNELCDGDGVDALLKISDVKSIPAVLLAAESSRVTLQKALEDHVMAYLVEPVQKEDIIPAVSLVMRRFEEFEDLRREVTDLKSMLEDRKLIERAKGILMQRDQLSEEEAYKQLRRSATDQRKKLVDVARDFLTQLEND